MHKYRLQNMLKSIQILLKVNRYVAKLCPYGIIRTNRKTLALQGVGGLSLFFFH